MKKIPLLFFSLLSTSPVLASPGFGEPLLCEEQVLDCIESEMATWSAEVLELSRQYAKKQNPFMAAKRPQESPTVKIKPQKQFSKRGDQLRKNIFFYSQILNLVKNRVNAVPEALALYNQLCAVREDMLRRLV